MVILSSAVYATVLVNVSGTRELITNICSITRRNFLCTWCTSMLIIYADERCVNCYRTPNFDGLKTFRTLTLARLLKICSGYVLEVNLEYLEHLHNEHFDLPFCPTRNEHLASSKINLATMYDKKRYVIILFIHYRNLQQCITVFM